MFRWCWRLVRCKVNRESLSSTVFFWILLCGLWGVMLNSVSMRITEFCIEKQSMGVQKDVLPNSLGKLPQLPVDEMNMKKYRIRQRNDSQSLIQYNDTSTKNQGHHLFQPRGQTLKNIPKLEEQFAGIGNTRKPKVNDLDIAEKLIYNNCKNYLSEGTLQRKVVPFYRKSKDIHPSDVTMVTHLSIDQLATFDLVLSHWHGPVSLALYVSRKAESFINGQLQHYPQLVNRSDVSIHLVVKAGSLYPANFLRNVALKYSVTEYVLLTDADLVPSSNLYEQVTKKLNQKPLPDNEVFVLPAFEANINNTKVPLSKDQLLKVWNFKGISDIKPLHYESNPKEHQITSYSRWRTTETAYFVAYDDGYAPNIVGHKSTLPEFYNPLIGRHLDKSSHTYLLYILRFRFLVLPSVFQVHIPHNTESSADTYWSCSNTLQQEYKKTVKDKYFKRKPIRI